MSIAELANTIRSVVKYDGKLIFDTSKPDGTPRKLMSNDKLTDLGWSPSIPFDRGIHSTYEWFLNNDINKVKPEVC